MKKLVKISTIWSLLICAGLLIGLCGGCTKKEVGNKGDIAITVSDSSGAPLSGVLVQVRQTEGTGTFTDVGTTTASGQLTYTGTAGADYFFTFSKAGFTTQTDIKRTPELNSMVTLVATMATQVSNKGDIAITVSDSSGAPLSGVLVQVRQTPGTGTFTDVGTTTASGQLTYTGTAGTDYFFTFSKAGYTTQTDIKRTPQLNSAVNLVVTLN